MKIIYDAERAKAHKKEIEEKVAQENIKRRKANCRRIAIAILLTLGYITLFVGGTAVLWPFLSPLRPDICAVVLFLITMVFGVTVGVTWWTACENLDSYIGSDDLRYHYTPDVKYYIATKDQNVLKQEFSDDGERLFLTLEDQDRFVTTETIFLYGNRTSTAIKEVTLDLEHDMVLMPYDEGEQKNAE